MANKLYVKGVTNYQIPTQEEYGVLLGHESPVMVQTVWRNDKAVIPLTICTGDEMVAEVSVKATDLTCGDAVLGGHTAQCAFISETKAFMGNGKKDNGSRKSFPDVLTVTEKIDIPANHIQNIWVSIPIPEDAVPGIYKGCVQVESPVLDIPVFKEITVEVLDLVLPQAKDYTFDIELWQYPYTVAQYYGLEPFGAAHLGVLRKHLQMYTDLGGHAITASIVEEPWNGQTYGQYPSMIKWKRRRDKSFTFDYTDFDKWVSFCKEMGMGDKIICYSIIPWGNKITYYDEKKGRMQSTSPKTGTRKYRKIWMQFLESLVAHTEEKGWFEDIYIGIDERKKMGKAFDLIESIKGKNGAPFKKSVAMDHFGQKYFPLIDRIDAISVGSEPTKKALPDFCRMIAHRSQNEAFKTTIYTCVGHFPNSFTYSMPMEGYWTMMFCGSLGTTGYLRWALDAWVKDPLQDTTHVSFEAGDCFLIYPDKADSPARESRSSVRFEMLAKGLRDINKLYVVAASSPEWDVRVKSLLSRIKPTYTQLHDGIADPKARTELPHDMADFIYEMNQLFRSFIK